MESAASQPDCLSIIGHNASLSPASHEWRKKRNEIKSMEMEMEMKMGIGIGNGNQNGNALQTTKHGCPGED